MSLLTGKSNVLLDIGVPNTRGRVCLVSKTVVKRAVRDLANNDLVAFAKVLLFVSLFEGRVCPGKLDLRDSAVHNGSELN